VRGTRRVPITVKCHSCFCADPLQTVCSMVPSIVPLRDGKTPDNFCRTTRAAPLDPRNTLTLGSPCLDLSIPPELGQRGSPSSATYTRICCCCGTPSNSPENWRSNCRHDIRGTSPSQDQSDCEMTSHRSPFYTNLRTTHIRSHACRRVPRRLASSRPLDASRRPSSCYTRRTRQVVSRCRQNKTCPCFPLDRHIPIEPPSANGTFSPPHFHRAA